MKKEKSCGAVVLRRTGAEWSLLLVKNKNGGHWAFPKGHMEGNETERETAIREVREETGLAIEISADFRAVTQYSPKEGIVKDVVYFLAVVETEKTRRQEAEIEEIRWLPLCCAEEKITFACDREIFRSARAYLEASLASGKRPAQ